MSGLFIFFYFSARKWNCFFGTFYFSAEKRKILLRSASSGYRRHPRFFVAYSAEVAHCSVPIR